MIGEAVLTNVSVSVADYDSAVLDAARGVLEGYTGDYYFFQYNIENWVLVMYDGDSVVSPFGLVASDCNIVQFRKTVVDTPYSVSHNFHGTLVGTEEQILNGSFYTTEHQITTSYKITSYHRDNVSISNSDGYLVYGSAPNLPHLIEGVQNYAFAGFALCLCVLSFKLIDRIFRRVY